MQIANSFNSFGSSNTPKKIMDIGPYSRKKFINELHVLVDSKGASYDAQKKWEKESPRGLNILGSGDWCFYARSKGVVYYVPFQPKEVEEEFLPHFFQGYAESFHLDAIMLSIFKKYPCNILYKSNSRSH